MVYELKFKRRNLYMTLENIVDSMQLNSGTEIASVETEELRCTLEVRGSVKVIFDGSIYTQPDEFPEELKELIASSDRWWDTDSRVEVIENNWFEMFCTDKKSGSIVCDVVDAEGLNGRQILDMLEEFAFNYAFAEIV